AGYGRDLGSARQARAQLLRHVLGGVDETAEDDWRVPSLELLLEESRERRQLLVLRAFEALGLLGQLQQPPARGVGRLLAFHLAAWGDVDALGRLLLHEVEDGAPADLVGFSHRVGVGRRRAVAQ